MTKLKVIIVGAGAIAQVHADAYLKYADACEIIGVCDVFEDKARELIDKKCLPARAFKNYEEALEKCGADIVSICSPPSMHAKVAIAALERGLNVLCEKPMAGSLEECDAMIAAAENSGKLLSLVAQNRFKTPNQKVKKMLDDKTAGDVRFATVNSLWWRGQNYYDLSWRGTWESEGGGCVVNHAVHHIDLLLWMMGRPQSVSATIANVGHDNSQCEDACVAALTYLGAFGQLTASLVTHDEAQEMIFQCEHGRLSVPWQTASTTALSNGFPKPDDERRERLEAAYRSLPELETEGHPAQVGNLLRAIRGEEKLLIDGRQGRDTIELITAIYKSAYLGAPVSLPLSPNDDFYKKGGVAAKMPHFHEKSRNVDNLTQTEPISLGRNVGK